MSKVLIGLLCTLSSLGVAHAADSQDAVSARQAVMKTSGKAIAELKRLLEADHRDIVAIRSEISRIKRASVEGYDLFPQASWSRPGVPSAARPDIWSEPAAFRKAEDRFAYTAEKLVQRGEAADFAGLPAALTEVSESCRSCHAAYRTKRAADAAQP